MPEPLFRIESPVSDRPAPRSAGLRVVRNPAGQRQPGDGVVGVADRPERTDAKATGNDGCLVTDH